VGVEDVIPEQIGNHVVYLSFSLALALWVGVCVRGSLVSPLAVMELIFFYKTHNWECVFTCGQLLPGSETQGQKICCLPVSLDIFFLVRPTKSGIWGLPGETKRRTREESHGEEELLASVGLAFGIGLTR
jgi:hypothetical protein